MGEHDRTDSEWIAMKNELLLKFIGIEKQNIKSGSQDSDRKMVDALFTELMKRMGENEG